jgi:hypothetical protein
MMKFFNEEKMGEAWSTHFGEEECIGIIRFWREREKERASRRPRYRTYIIGDMKILKYILER